jgi:drug/metabolite transporter (DMT)-like permease
MDVKKYFTNRFLIILITSISCFFWGCAFPLLKISFVDMNIATNDIGSKILFAGIRFLLAAIILLIVIIFVLKIKIGVNKVLLFKLILLGVVQTTLPFYFIYNGLANTSGVKSSILTGAIPLFGVILSHFAFIDDKINTKKIIGLLVGFIGIVVANKGNGVLDLKFTIQGEGYLLISGFFLSLGFVISKKLSKETHPMLVAMWQMFLGSIFLISFGLQRFSANSVRFTSKSLLILLFVTVFSTVVAFCLWFTLLKYNKTGKIFIYYFLMPVFGTIMSVVLISGEAFTFSILWGLILVSIGILVVNIKNEKS